ncbi:MAG: sigma-70 family RNA polymerase sigma factor [Clostridia bacterium]|nr:sigma-70 family RNA polymerase sigma factor [Clostridia bacterium]
MSARNKLIEDNVNLVHACAKRFIGRGIEYDDLYGAGCIGLIKAADGFDETRGLCFSTYAVPSIMGEIKRQFRDTGAVKVSRRLKELSLKIAREKEYQEKHTGESISVNSLAEKLGTTPEEITEAICASRQVLSLTYEDDDGTSEIQIPVESCEEDVCSKIEMQQALEKLDEIERKIIRLRYFNEKTQNESAVILGISQVQVSRKEKKALEKLRKTMV